MLRNMPSLALTKSLADEGEHRIKVSAICPGVWRTNWWMRRREHVRRVKIDPSISQKPRCTWFASVRKRSCTRLWLIVWARTGRRLLKSPPATLSLRSEAHRASSVRFASGTLGAH